MKAWLLKSTKKAIPRQEYLNNGQPIALNKDVAIRINQTKLFGTMKSMPINRYEYRREVFDDFQP